MFISVCRSSSMMELMNILDMCMRLHDAGLSQAHRDTRNPEHEENHRLEGEKTDHCEWTDN